MKGSRKQEEWKEGDRMRKEAPEGRKQRRIGI